MTTTTYSEWHSNIGSIWARAVALWESYIGVSTTSWAFTTLSVSSMHTLKITLTGATDTNIYQLIDASALYGDVAPLYYPFTCPGWLASPAVQPATQAGRTTKTDFDTNMTALREALWYEWCSASQGTRRSEDFNLNYPSMTSWVRYFTLKYNNFVFIDAVQVVTATQTSTTYVYGGHPFSTPIQPAQPIIIAPSGGGSVDLAPVVAALNELAMVDNNVSVNNGAAMWSVRGKVRTS